MATAVKIAPFTYTLKREKKAAQPTIFSLKPLTGMQSIEVSDARERGLAHAIRVALGYGLITWDHLTDGETGAPVKFGADMDDNLAQLYDEDLSELYVELADRSGLSEDQQKN